MRIPLITSNIPDIQIANISNELVRNNCKPERNVENTIKMQKCDVKLI